MSTYYFTCAKNSDDSVKPDHEVKLPIENLLNDIDKYMEYAFELIDRDRAKK